MLQQQPYLALAAGNRQCIHDWHQRHICGCGALCYAQIPLCRLPRDVRDKPVTLPLAQIPLHRLPRNLFPGSRRNGIWALRVYAEEKTTLTVTGLSTLPVGCIHITPAASLQLRHHRCSNQC